MQLPGVTYRASSCESKQAVAQMNLMELVMDMWVSLFVEGTLAS